VGGDCSCPHVKSYFFGSPLPKKRRTGIKKHEHTPFFLLPLKKSANRGRVDFTEVNIKFEN